MPLNLSVGDADFTPYLKYNAKAGRFYAKPEGGTEDVEIVNPTLAFDMARIKTGWIVYLEGAGPEKVWDPSPSQVAPRPPGDKKWKRGFEVLVIGNAIVPGTSKKLGLREFSSTAGNAIAAIVRMHGEYEAGLASNPGKVPIYTCKSVKPVNGMYGTNYEPLFELSGWVDRAKVAAFDEHAGKSNGHAEPPRADHGFSVSSGSTGAPVMPRRSSADMDDDMVPF